MIHDCLLLQCKKLAINKAYITGLNYSVFAGPVLNDLSPRTVQYRFALDGQTEHDLRGVVASIVGNAHD